MMVIGVDLGGTKSAAAIFTESGKIVKEIKAPLNGRTGHDVARLIIEQLDELLRHTRQKKHFIAAVGVSVPGIYYSKTGNVWAPNIPGWEEYPLLRELQLAIGDCTTQIKIDSDRAAYILGETWLGCAKGCRNAIFVAVGTGIGAGILIDGKILRGHGDIAGATGWMALDRPFCEEYIPCGCFEYHASGEGIAKVAKELLKTMPDYTGQLRNKPSADITSHDVFAAREKGDSLADRVIQQAVEFWGMAVANYVSLFNPEKIIFGGGIFGPASRYLADIRREAAKWAQPISMKQVSIEQSQLGGKAGLIGAGKIALSALTEE